MECKNCKAKFDVIRIFNVRGKLEEVNKGIKYCPFCGIKRLT
jgi:DNA-directed RNA polymerase subunit RPC12/RpoP